MRAVEAFDALGRLLAGSEPQTIVARIDWNVLKPLLEAGGPRPFLGRVARHPRSVKPGREGADRFRAEPASNGWYKVPFTARKDVLTEFVRTEAAAVLGVRTPDLVDPARNLFTMGMDSLMAIELKGRLERAVSGMLPAALAFNYPTVNDLVKFLDTIVPNLATFTDSDLEDVNEIFSRLPDMSIAEVDSLLAKMLAEDQQA